MMGLSSTLLAAPMSIDERLELFQEKLQVPQVHQLLKYLRIFDHICKQVRDEFHVDATVDRRYSCITEVLDGNLPPAQLNDTLFSIQQTLPELAWCFNPLGKIDIDLMMKLLKVAYDLRQQVNVHLDNQHYQRPYAIRNQEPIQAAPTRAHSMYRT